MTKEVILVQRDNFASLNKLSRNHLKDSKERHSLGYFQARTQRLEELWQACQERHEAVLDDLSGDSSKQKSYLEEYESAEETYLDLLTRFKSGLAAYQPITQHMNSSGSAATNRVRLERLTIPKFDGKYSQWRMFNDMFNSLIHCNETLSVVEKMQYLKTHVQGDAARVIQHLDVNNENYEAARHMLRERYDNKRAMAWNYLHKFHNLPMAKEDSDSSIKRVMDATAEFIANMNSIGVNTEH
ncbi:uncharacterized protein LOC119660103 [Hermetia illucens]|uniref:uncharacterized protein LOC119660103 n=1 Tax=Hermetia illucens TaxID=343691 RepID=UPI0018CC337E|nr:uncharacterized protein LOC119660103 [Hermetia illucens]